MFGSISIASHILTELGEISDSAAIIEAGEILVHGTIEELRKHKPKRADGDDSGGATGLDTDTDQNDVGVDLNDFHREEEVLVENADVDVGVEYNFFLHAYSVSNSNVPESARVASAS